MRAEQADEWESKLIMSKCQQRCFSKSFVAEASIHVAYIGKLKKGNDAAIAPKSDESV